MGRVVVTGSFDDLRSPHIRFLEEASKHGDVHVLLLSDETVRALEGKAPRFPEGERVYFLQAIRYVKQVTLVAGRVERDMIPQAGEIHPNVWVVDEAGDNKHKRDYCTSSGVSYRILKNEELRGFPELTIGPQELQTGSKKVIVTGCFDWLHSGHVRFFEEVSGLGDLYVIVGHDVNIRFLKGEGHPLLPQDERRYTVQSVRYVKQALISTGTGWLDAEPEIARLKPDIYAVNEDGDRPEKQAFCSEHGIQYVVLKRMPKAGLPPRESKFFRGF